MRKKTHTARSGLRSGRQIQASFGARHPIEYDKGVRAFFNELDARWAKVLPERDPEAQIQSDLPLRRFVLYDDPAKMGLSVVEKRLSEQHARRYRVRWAPHDVGRMRSRIEDEIARQGFPDTELQLTLSAALRLGEMRRRDTGGKFGLAPEASDAVSGILAEERGIILDGLNGALRHFQYPDEEYVPHLTVGRVYRGTDPEKLAKCGEILHELIEERPLTITLAPLVFVAHQEM